MIHASVPLPLQACLKLAQQQTTKSAAGAAAAQPSQIKPGCKLFKCTPQQVNACPLTGLQPQTTYRCAYAGARAAAAGMCGQGGNA